MEKTKDILNAINDIKSRKMRSSELKFIKQVRGNYFVQVPKITSQYLGFGKGKTGAYLDAINSLEDIERRFA